MPGDERRDGVDLAIERLWQLPHDDVIFQRHRRRKCRQSPRVEFHDDAGSDEKKFLRHANDALDERERPGGERLRHESSLLLQRAVGAQRGRVERGDVEAEGRVAAALVEAGHVEGGDVEGVEDEPVAREDERGVGDGMALDVAADGDGAARDVLVGEHLGVDVVDDESGVRKRTEVESIFDEGILRKKRNDGLFSDERSSSHIVIIIIEILFVVTIVIIITTTICATSSTIQ